MNMICKLTALHFQEGKKQMKTWEAERSELSAQLLREKEVKQDFFLHRYLVERKCVCQDRKREEAKRNALQSSIDYLRMEHSK